MTPDSPGPSPGIEPFLSNRAGLYQPGDQGVTLGSIRAPLRGWAYRLAATYSRKLAALEALKKSLLNQAFTGKL